MPVSSLKSVITGSFISALSKTGGSGKSPAPGLGAKAGSGEALDVTLRSAARNMAVGVQSLNLGISYVNISRDLNSKLLGFVDRLELLVSKASKGGFGSSSANAIREEFAALADKFQEGIKNAKVEGQDVLDADALKDVLARSGLKPEDIEPLADAFNDMTSLSKTVVEDDGSRTASTALIPVDQFANAMRKASAMMESDDPEEQGAISGLFKNVRDTLRGLGSKIRKNVDALDKTQEVLKKNIDLVRATGFAFLEASSSVTGTEDPEKLAEQIRQKIQAAAPSTISQVHNLQGIMVAGFTAAQAQAEQASKKK
jgi:flagellin-like hook-associated protein FlgL